MAGTVVGGQIATRAATVMPEGVLDDINRATGRAKRTVSVELEGNWNNIGKAGPLSEGEH